MNSIALSEERDEETCYGYCDDYQPHAVRHIFDEENMTHCDLRWDPAGNLGQISVSLKDNVFDHGRFLFWTVDNRMHAAVDDKHYSYYTYDYTGERRLKLTGESNRLDVNADFMTTGTLLNTPTLYPSAYLVLTSKGYTKHYYAGADRVAASLGGGGLKATGSNPEMQERANGLFGESHDRINGRMLQENDHECIWQSSLPTGEYCKPIDGIPGRMKASVEFYLNDLYYNLKMLAEEQHDEKDVYFYHSDHLGSASWITDADGKPIQHLQYLPFGEPFVNQHLTDYQERYLFTGKERDEETEYGYFGARYMDHELTTMWLSVDPMSDKYPGISPYAYCAWNPVKLVDPDGREMFPTESAAAKVRANAVDMFGESRVGEIYNKGDEKHPNYAFLVYDHGKDKYERPSSKGVWAYKPDKCVDSKFDLFLYATFKAEKEWSFNGSFSIGGQCGVDVGFVNLGINISSIDLVGIDWDWGKGKVDTYHCEENNARGSRGVSLGLFTLAGQTYEGGDYIDEDSKRTNVLGVGVGQSKGQWNITLGASAILGIQISISSKIKK